MALLTPEEDPVFWEACNCTNGGRVIDYLAATWADRLTLVFIHGCFPLCHQ